MSLILKIIALDKSRQPNMEFAAVVLQTSSPANKTAAAFYSLKATHV